MKKLVFAAAFLAAGGLCLHDVSVGHGGTYRGPGDTVPPGGGGGGGGPASGPSGPSSPGSGGPSGPGPSSPGRSPGGPASGPKKPKSPKGTGGGEDLTGWQFWWGFNKEPYLNLKSHIHGKGSVTGSDDFFLGRGEKAQSKSTLAPSEETIRTRIVPALLAALETERQNDIVTGCLIALAKIGDPKDEAGEGKEGFASVIAKSLTSSSQEIKETAALALGILGNSSSIEPLTHLGTNTLEGRKLISRGGAANEVDDRTRSFSLYGLGLIGNRLPEGPEGNEMRKQIIGTLVDVLQNDGKTSAQRDLSVACLTAMGLVALDSDPTWAKAEDGSYSANACRQSQVKWMLEFYQDEEVNFLVRAHCPTAIARMIQFSDPRYLYQNRADKEFAGLKTEAAKIFSEDIGKHSKKEREIQASCILALGLLGDADEQEVDKDIREALMDVSDNIADHQARHFALVSLGQVGGRGGAGEEPYKGTEAVRKKLMTSLSKGRGHIPSWAGLGLGVLERSLTDNDQSPSTATSEALKSQLKKAGSPREIGAYALALGIMVAQDGLDTMLEKMDKIDEPGTRGYCALGLGLLGDRKAVEPIQEIVKESEFRPELLRSAATALGLLGDEALVDDLVEMLSTAKGLASQASISRALGFIGDRRSVDPLVGMLQNDNLTGSARGFAAVALGIVADKEELPWNAKISVNLNYRANTKTLTDSKEGTGILDIL